MRDRERHADDDALRGRLHRARRPLESVVQPWNEHRNARTVFDEGLAETAGFGDLHTARGESRGSAPVT